MFWIKFIGKLYVLFDFSNPSKSVCVTISIEWCSQQWIADGLKIIKNGLLSIPTNSLLLQRLLWVKAILNIIITKAQDDILNCSIMPIYYHLLDLFNSNCYENFHSER